MMNEIDFLDNFYQKVEDNNTLIDDIFQSLPESQKTEEASLFAVRANPYNIVFVPEKSLTDRVITAAVQRDGDVIAWIPENRLTDAMYADAIDSNGLALKYVPKERMTREMCQAAVKDNGMALEFVPENIRTKTLCREAMKNTGDHHIVAHLPYPDLCLKAWKKVWNGHFEHADRREMLQCMHPKGWSGQLAEKATRYDGTFIQYVPKNLASRDLYMKAIDNTGAALQYIPDEYKTKEVCENAVRSSHLAVEGLPQEFKNEAFYSPLVAEKPDTLIGIPSEQRTTELCRLALEKTFFKNTNDISLVMHITDSELFLKVLETKADFKGLDFMMLFMDDKAFSPKVASHIAERFPEALTYMPNQFLTNELLEKSLQKLPSQLGLIPADRRTPEMCLIAVKGDPEMKKHVPPAISSADNLYTFCLDTEKKYGLNLSVKDAKDLYAGKPLKTDRINAEKESQNGQVIKKEPSGPNMAAKPPVRDSNMQDHKNDHISGNRKKSGIKPRS